MTKYMNKKSGNIVTVVEENTKFKTVIIETADGKTKTIQTASLKKHYTPIDTPAEAKEEVIETVSIPVEAVADEVKEEKEAKIVKRNPETIAKYDNILDTVEKLLDGDCKRTDKGVYFLTGDCNIFPRKAGVCMFMSKELFKKLRKSDYKTAREIKAKKCNYSVKVPADKIATTLERINK